MWIIASASAVCLTELSRDRSTWEYLFTSRMASKIISWICLVIKWIKCKHNFMSICWYYSHFRFSLVINKEINETHYILQRCRGNHWLWVLFFLGRMRSVFSFFFRGYQQFIKLKSNFIQKNIFHSPAKRMKRTMAKEKKNTRPWLSIEFTARLLKNLLHLNRKIFEASSKYRNLRQLFFF